MYGSARGPVRRELQRKKPYDALVKSPIPGKIRTVKGVSSTHGGRYTYAIPGKGMGEVCPV